MRSQNRLMNVNRENNKLCYSIDEASKVTGLSKSILYKYVASGRIEVLKVGSRVLIPVDSFRNWLFSQKRMLNQTCKTYSSK